MTYSESTPSGNTAFRLTGRWALLALGGIARIALLAIFVAIYVILLGFYVVVGLVAATIGSDLLARRAERLPWFGPARIARPYRRPTLADQSCRPSVALPGGTA